MSVTVSTISRPEGNLRIENDVIQVSYLSDIDGNWRFTDAAGHEHHCDYEAADHYPTLLAVIEEPWYCADCHETHENMTDHLECRQCGEHVTPGMTGPGTKMIPGLTSYYINDEPVSREQAEEFIARLSPRR